MNAKFADLKAKLAALLFTVASMLAGVLTYLRVVINVGDWQWILIGVALCSAVLLLAMIGAGRLCAWKHPIGAVRPLNLTVLLTATEAALFVSGSLWLG